LALERTAWGSLLPRLPRLLRHAYTLLVVMLGWVLFRADTFDQAIGMVRAMAGLAPGDTSRWSLGLYLGRDVQMGLLVGAVASAPVLPWLGQRWLNWRRQDRSWAGKSADGLMQFAVLLSLAALLVASAVLLAAATHNPFIYFRF
jgi:alginate O-acetyltransferase complex protein AlgI